MPSQYGWKASESAGFSPIKSTGKNSVPSVVSTSHHDLRAVICFCMNDNLHLRKIENTSRNACSSSGIACRALRYGGKCGEGNKTALGAPLCCFGKNLLQILGLIGAQEFLLHCSLQLSSALWLHSPALISALIAAHIRVFCIVSPLKTSETNI